MKRLAIKKLIVISQSESRSLEVPFENGLNIILGGNKTGKSSIIKSIFTTFADSEFKRNRQIKFPRCQIFHLLYDFKPILSHICCFLNMGKSSFVLFAKAKNFRFLRIMRIPILALSKRKLFTNIVTV